MIGYFFSERKDKQVLYVPRNVIVTEDTEGFDINYYPDNIKAYDLLWDKKRYDLIRVPKDRSIWQVNIDNKMLGIFADHCFLNQHLEAHILAIDMFKMSKNEVGLKSE